MKVMMRTMNIAALALAMFGLLSQGAMGQESGTLTGKVVTQGGEAAAGAKISLPDLRRTIVADARGEFKIEGVPAGEYIVQVSSPRYGGAFVETVVKAGEVTDLTITVDLSFHAEQVTVSAAPLVRGISELAQAVTVLDGVELQSRIEATLGETLASEPGIAATSFTPGASRPVIRGLGGDRVRILEGSVGVGDASNVSPDHAVSFDPLGANQIEVVRGPATLMYGGNAVGGVVNVLDGRIPDRSPQAPLTGEAELRYGTNAEDRSGGVSLDGGVKSFAWHLAGLARKTDDFSSADGVLENSDLESDQGSIGASWIGANAFAGVSYKRFDSVYGIANPEEPVRIDMEQSRWDFHGEWNPSAGFVQGVRVRFGISDYEHSELEPGGAVGTRFLSDAWEGRVEVPHRKAGPFTGAFGLQVADRELEAIGEEAFVPPTATSVGALFVYEEVGSGPLSFPVGVRYERQRSEAREGGDPDREFSGVSAAAGVVWKPGDDFSIAGTLSRSLRFPTAEELYADGPHLATFQFEVGDPSLDEETGLGVDLSVRGESGIVGGELRLFANDFTDFIFLQPTGRLIDLEGEEIPEFAYIQADAEFRGLEVHADLALVHEEPHHLDLELRADYVRAELSDSGEPLPFIPPLHAALGLKYKGDRWSAFGEAAWTDDQTRVAPNETPTDGYVFFNAGVGYRLIAGRTVHDFLLRGTNLTDELARNAVSPLKDVIPLTGRDVTASWRVEF